MPKEDYEEMFVSDGRGEMDQIVIDVLELISDKGFIAGGCPRYYATKSSDDSYSDIDVFCFAPIENEHGVLTPAGRIIIARSNFGVLTDRFIDAGFKQFKETPNSVMFAKDIDEDGQPVPNTDIIQIIRPFQNEWMQTFGTMIEVLDQFDFTVSKIAILEKHLLLVHKEFKEHEETKKLVIKHINCPIAVMQRVVKYSKKGYRCFLKDSIKLFKEWVDRPQEYRDRLHELIETGEDISPEELEELEHLLRMD